MHFDKYVNSPDRKLFLTDDHFTAVDWSRACRSIKLGRAVLACPGCGEVSYIARSCKHRFCATCGAADTYKWSLRLLSKLMNCHHHHIVMTLPKAYRNLSKKNGNKLHDILFKSSASIMGEWFEENHGVKVGVVSVLHTAGADLKYHPHVHQIVSRGGLDLKNNTYKFIGGDYLCKNEILGKLLKAKFNEMMISSYDRGELEMYESIKSKTDLLTWIGNQKETHWIVNIEKPLEDVHQIVGYVGRYTKRACMSEYKLEEVSQDVIKFRYNDYKNSVRGEKAKEAIIRMKPYEFLDNLLQHVPSKGYRMVRYSGLYNSYYLNRIPEQLKLGQETKAPIEWDQDYDWGIFEQYRKDFIKGGHADPLICVHCQLLKEIVLIEFESHSYEPQQIVYDSS